MTKKEKAMRKRYRRRRFWMVLLLLIITGGVGFLSGWVMLKEDTAEPEVSTEPLAIEAMADVSEEPQEPKEAGPADGDVGWQTLLVNWANPLPDDFSVELEQISRDNMVDARIAEPLKRMIAAAKEDGINLVIHSAYRSVDYQQTLAESHIQSYIAAGNSREEAERLSAQWLAEPGSSEHHTGLALDILSPDYPELDEGFAKTRAYGWLSENAHLYGFILRYPDGKTGFTQIGYEPWHYRYVGEAAAAEIKALDICLEEYIFMKQLLDAKTEDLIVGGDEPIEEPDASE